MNFQEEKRCINGALVLIGSGLRMHLFNKIAPLLSDKGYWYALGSAYIMSDWCSDNISTDIQKQLFGRHTPEREFLMSSAERRYFNSLPETVTIYRGMTVTEKESGQYGLSWTLSKEVAEFFAFEYSRYSKFQEADKMVHSLTVDKRNLICYFQGRNEEEVIYNHVDTNYNFDQQH